MAVEMTTKYRWSIGRSPTSVDADTFGRVIEQLNNPSPKGIVDYARPEESPIHALFQWDNDVAGELWRLDQARKLVRSIRIEVIGRDDRSYSTRAFPLIRLPDAEPGDEEEEPDNRSRYVAYDVVQRSPDLSVKVLDQAREEIVKWYQTYIGYYQTLPEFGRRFGPVFRSIEDVIGDSETAG